MREDGKVEKVKREVPSYWLEVHFVETHAVLGILLPPQPRRLEGGEDLYLYLSLQETRISLVKGSPTEQLTYHVRFNSCRTPLS